MKFNTFVSSHQDIAQCIKVKNLDEILLEPHLLARRGRLSMQEAETLAIAAMRRGLRPILVWDALMPEHVMAEICEALGQWHLDRYAAIRVCDIGAAQWLKMHRPEMPIQLIVETGSHNKEALLGWSELFASTLERFILSIELPEEKLIEYCQDFSIPCEILGVGQILLFYSPRSLLAHHMQPAIEDDSASTETPWIETSVTSEKSETRAYPTLETAHGTFMFLDKDQFILDRLDALTEAGLSTVCLDLRHLSEEGHAASGIDEICQHILTDAAALRTRWPRPTRAPFFKANRTTAQFSRMKSKVHQYRDESCLAEVVSIENGRYIVFHTLRAFAISSISTLVLPTGETVSIPDGQRFRTFEGQHCESVEAGQILITAWIKKTCAGALLKGA